MKLSWAEFKTICNSKMLLMQMTENEVSYRLFATEGAVRYLCSFLKETSDQVDFDANYKSLHTTVDNTSAVPILARAAKVIMEEVPKIPDPTIVFIIFRIASDAIALDWF